MMLVEITLLQIYANVCISYQILSNHIRRHSLYVLHANMSEENSGQLKKAGMVRWRPKKLSSKSQLPVCIIGMNWHRLASGLTCLGVQSLNLFEPSPLSQQLFPHVMSVSYQRENLLAPWTCASWQPHQLNPFFYSTRNISAWAWNTVSPLEKMDAHPFISPGSYHPHFKEKMPVMSSSVVL